MISHEFGLDYAISFRKIDPSDAKILNEFECENPAISDFIRNQSLKSCRDVSYLFIDNENRIVIAFCAICCTGISTTECDELNQPYISSIPAVEIDFFAVDERYRNLPLDKDSGRYETLSNALFLYMVDYIKQIASSVIGATHICLYSVPKAKNFYKRCDFVEYDRHMNKDEKPFVEGCIPMFYKI